MRDNAILLALTYILILAALVVFGPYLIGDLWNYSIGYAFNCRPLDGWLRPFCLMLLLGIFTWPRINSK